LDELVGECVKASIAPSTSRVYASAQKRYLAFCSKVNARSLSLTEKQICCYTVFLYQEGIQHSSMKGYLAALRRMQIVWGMGDPVMSSWPLLECTLNGIKRSQARNVATRLKSRLPITPALLEILGAG